MENRKTTIREDWPSLEARINQSFQGDHGRPKKHIYLSRDDWEKIKKASKEACQEMDEVAIQRLLTPVN